MPGIILCIGAIILIIVLFFIAELISKNNTPKKTEPIKKEEPKPEIIEVKPETNLANDVERLITTDKKNDSKKLESASRRSHLVNRSRMREYYDKKYAERVNKFEENDNDNTEQASTLDITDEEARKLIALAEVLKRKEG